MWFVRELMQKNAVLVRYSGVKIVDRRNDNEDYNSEVEDLYDIIIDGDVKPVPLSKDPSWKAIVAKFDRLGYDLREPEKVTRIEKQFRVESEFYWDFDRYDEEHKEPEPEVLCLPS